jgi:hypothetical protein
MAHEQPGVPLRYSRLGVIPGSTGETVSSCLAARLEAVPCTSPATTLSVRRDALATKAVTTGKVGPRLAPFTADPAEALASLARLERIDAAVVLPGHGEAWTGGIVEAVRRVRAAGIPSRRSSAARDPRAA